MNTMPFSLLDTSSAPDPAIQLDARRLPVADFDAAVAAFDGVVQEMTVAFAQSRWPGVALEPWIYEQNGVAVAAALVMIQRLPLRAGQLAVVKWGPILRNETDALAGPTYEAAITHLTGEYATRRNMMLSVMARAEQQPPLEAGQKLARRGFETGSGLMFPNRYVVNVRLADDAQRQSFSQKWRYHLKKADGAGLSFEVADESHLPRFQALYEAMTDRKKFPDYSAYDTLPALFRDLPASLRPQLFFVTHQGVDVAGAVIFTAGRTAVYLYGATNNEALPLRAGYLMHARILSWLRDHTEAAWYDLGGTDGFQGLHQFKKGMVGKAGYIAPVPPILNFAASTRALMAGKLAYAVRDGLQQVRRVVNVWRGRIPEPDQVDDA